jgi:NADPH:quinone reductase-like Zn-dependent oxidoreductase
MSGIDFSVNRDGFLAEQVVVPAQGLVRIPNGMSYEDASTLPNAGLTAWHAVVVDAQVRPGESVLTLGTGGVSMFGMQWARMLGARVAVTSSSDEKLAKVRALGAEMTVNYRSRPDWPEAILEQTNGRGVDVVLNTVGISEMERCIRACASNGRIMLIGSNSVAPAGSNAEPEGLKSFPRNMIMHGLIIQGVIVGSRRMLEDLVQAVATNGMRPVIDRVFPFDQATEAVQYLESGAKVGKIVIRVS